MLVPWLLTMVVSASLLAALYLWLQRRRTADRGPARRETVKVPSDEEELKQALERLAERRQRPE